MNYDKASSELEECKKQLIQLQKENEELQNDLHSVNGKLRDSEQLKGHFISNVSNEIINPFSSIIAISQGIKQLGESEMPRARHMAGLIFEEAFHLDFQLKNIFAAALIEAGKEVVKSSGIDLNDLLGQIVQYFSPLIEKKQIILVQSGVDSLPIFITDREKLDLILKNLISNSIKYSPESSVINVKLSIDDSVLNVLVSDSGKGIPSGDRELIFDRFKQLDEKINSINTGHGLGLSIVKAYAEMLGGNVDISNNSGSGMTICVRIPENGSDEDWGEFDDFIFDSEVKY